LFIKNETENNIYFKNKKQRNIETVMKFSGKYEYETMKRVSGSDNNGTCCHRFGQYTQEKCFLIKIVD
jgi:hypothetical protein